MTDEEKVMAMDCKHCYGRGTQADYMGLEMRCVEVECPDCNGTGKSKIELSKQFLALQTAAEEMAEALAAYSSGVCEDFRCENLHHRRGEYHAHDEVCIARLHREKIHRGLLAALAAYRKAVGK